MAIYIYKIADGTLVSWNQNDADPVAPAAQLAAQGLTSVSGLSPLDSSHAWDAPSHSVVTVVAPTPANIINTFDFIMAFTANELAAIRASSDNNVQRFLFALQVTQGVNLNATSMTGALNYLVTVTLLTGPRATAISATLKGNAASGTT